MIRVITFLMLASFSFISFAGVMGNPTNYHLNKHGDISIKLIHADKGGARMFEQKVPGVDGKGEMDAMCFDTQMVSSPGNVPFGSAVDCLSEVMVNDAGVVTLIGTTYFNLPKGTIIGRGFLTVSPIAPGTKTISGMKVTHITGGASKGRKSIIGGTGIYEGARGNVRLSGMVNMSKFQGKRGDPVGFSCLFEITNLMLDKSDYHLFE